MHSKFDVPLRLGVAVALILGVLAIVSQRPMLTTAGVLLVIVGLMSLMPVVRLGLADDVTEFRREPR